MIVLLIISILANGALGYAVWNLLRKNEVMEDAIDIFYTRLDRTLQTIGLLTHDKCLKRTMK